MTSCTRQGFSVISVTQYRHLAAARGSVPRRTQRRKSLPGELCSSQRDKHWLLKPHNIVHLTLTVAHKMEHDLEIVYLHSVNTAIYMWAIILQSVL